MTARSRYLARCLAVCVRHPIEGVDRVRGRLELVRGSGVFIDHEPRPDWHARLHELVPAPWPCDTEDDFDRLWRHLEETTQGGIGMGHDADRAIVWAAWCAIRHLPAATVVETGVGRGLSTRFMLESLSANRTGHLWSIDLPPIVEGWHHQSALFVTDTVRERWSYVRGSSRRRLPHLLEQVGMVDLAFLSSGGTEPTVRFELESVWPALRPGGVVVVEGIDRNDAFATFAGRLAPGSWLAATPATKAGSFGIAVKEPAP